MTMAVICPPIHSMVVVTSPIGDQAPPALAAMMMTPANTSLSSRFDSNFFINDTITMAVVRLSNTELRKKVRVPTNHISVDKRLVRIREVMISNPPWESTTSTIVMAPMRKKIICAVVTNDSFKCSVTKGIFPTPKA